MPEISAKFNASHMFYEATIFNEWNLFIRLLNNVFCFAKVAGAANNYYQTICVRQLIQFK